MNETTLATDAPVTLPDKDTLRVIYTELCNSHHGIADFRAKLLALLPIASGTGFFLLIDTKPLEDAEGMATVGIGAVGALLIFGLYLYELRGIQRCNALSRCCEELEMVMMGGLHGHGAFSGEPKGVSLASNTNASLVIYPTMIASWVFLVVFGLAPAEATWWLPGVVAAGAWWAANAWGRGVMDKANKQRDEDHGGCEARLQDMLRDGGA